MRKITITIVSLLAVVVPVIIAGLLVTACVKNGSFDRQLETVTISTDMDGNVTSETTVFSEPNYVLANAIMATVIIFSAIGAYGVYCGLIGRSRKKIYERQLSLIADLNSRSDI